jgi:hypothetical protein
MIDKFSRLKRLFNKKFVKQRYVDDLDLGLFWGWIIENFEPIDSRVGLPVILQITKIIDGLADEYNNEQKLAYMGNDQKTIRENDIKINTLMELKRIIAKSNLSK